MPDATNSHSFAVMNRHSHALLIRGGRVYDHGGDVHQPSVADIRILGDRIAAVGRDLEPAPGEAVIEATHRLVIPGLVNAHYHSHDAFAKGLIEELPLEIGLSYSRMPDARSRSADEIRARTLLGAWECLRNGITTLQDMNNRFPLEEDYLDVVLKAYADIGIRVVFSSVIQDIDYAQSTPYWCELVPTDGSSTVFDKKPGWRPQVEFIEAQIKRYTAPGSCFHWALGPSAPQRCSSAMLEAVGELAGRYDLPIYTHLLETRAQALAGRLSYAKHDGSLVRYLADLGVLGPRVNLVHAVWLRADEIDLIGNSGSRVVHNPASNLKYKSGIAPMLDIREAGVDVALGCDNVAGGDTQNMFLAMKLYSYLAAVSDPKPGRESALEAMRAATLGGAASALLEGEIGAIKPGMKADLVILDLDDPAFLPFNSAVRQLVYSESGRAVETVIVDGRVVIRNGKLTTIDENELRQSVAELSMKFRRDFANLVEHNARARPHMEAAIREIWKRDVGIERLIPRARHDRG